MSSQSADFRFAWMLFFGKAAFWNWLHQIDFLKSGAASGTEGTWLN